MTCDKCDSVRIISVDGKVSDLCSLEYKGDEYFGYVPVEHKEICLSCNENMLNFRYCLDCGKLQGEFPVGEPDWFLSADDTFDEDD